MNKKWIALLFSLSLCFCMSCSDSESGKKEEGKVEEEKPVTVLSKTVPLADPYILVYDSLYYIYGTNVGTGFDVYYSKDLEYWERASALSLSHTNSYGESMFWAPEVYYVEKIRSSTCSIRRKSIFVLLRQILLWVRSSRTSISRSARKRALILPSFLTKMEKPIYISFVSTTAMSSGAQS